MIISRQQRDSVKNQCKNFYRLYWRNGAHTTAPYSLLAKNIVIQRQKYNR